MRGGFWMATVSKCSHSLLIKTFRQIKQLSIGDVGVPAIGRAVRNCYGDGPTCNVAGAGPVSEEPHGHAVRRSLPRLNDLFPTAKYPCQFQVYSPKKIAHI